ncbi:MAG TPA: amidohydrolase family protein [Thermoanaerobaculia bacterium]|nr:amidohydrolase family protein [Thermoanaerobaculia bacterium]
MTLRRLVAFSVLLVPLLSRADAPGVYAITGGTVHTVSGTPIANGTVIVRDGLIEAVGANVAVPADATIIDVAGSHVYPGLIDAQTSLGFAAASSGRGSARPGERTERPPEPTPDFLAIRNVKLTDDDADARRAIGVTTIVTTPANGIFNGQSAIVNLGSGPIESRVIKSPAALQISFNTRPTWTYPDSLMGVVAFIRQTFLDAQQHVTATEIYTRSPSGLERPQENPGLEALRPVLRRDLPVVFIADTELMMRRAMTLARELNVRYVLSGARQGYAMPADLKNVPVLVSVKWPTAPTDKDDREDQPLRVIRDRQLAPTTPGVLAKNGVAFALVSGAAKTSELLPGVRKAIENGLSAEDALRAMTLAPARIFGVDRQLGTLERGKIANVVVSDKPLFEKEAKVKRVFVDGREIRLPAEEKKDAAASASASVIDGTWALNVRAPEGNVAIQVTLTAEDGRVTGTFSGDRGSGDIKGGSLDGTNFEFTISANASDAEASDWVFRGTLDGDAMSGTVTTSLGNFEFSGSRSK